MSLNFTDRLLKDAGIRTGMKVLDIGCGTGELSSQASAIVQDSGLIVAVDVNEKALTKPSRWRLSATLEYRVYPVDLSDLSFLRSNSMPS